ncbi:MAG: hypothetical protein IPK33_23625 [Gemmatimonadetes bacterium]|nr:hypothetical protein [Gemmatimonadota bacterium]
MLDVAALQRTGGLVHEEDTRIGCQRPADLDVIWRAGRLQLAQGAIGVDLGVREFLEQGTRARTRGASVDPSPFSARRFAA